MIWDYFYSLEIIAHQGKYNTQTSQKMKRKKLRNKDGVAGNGWCSYGESWRKAKLKAP